MQTAKWPKILPPLTSEQKLRHDEFMRLWHEHLPNLPGCVREAHRLLHKERGQLLIVIPTEGSLAYTLARKISAERLWNRHFGSNYAEFYKREHINLVPEILEELHPYFTTETESFFPLRVPFWFCNLCIGLVLAPRPAALVR